MGIDPRIVLLRGKSKSIPVSATAVRDTRKQRHSSEPLEWNSGSLLGRYLEIKNPRYYSGSVAVAEFRSIAVVFCTKVYRGALINGHLRGEGIWSADKMRDWARKEKNREVVVYNNWRDEKMTLDEWFTPYDTPDVLRNYMIANKISILVEMPPKYQHEPKEFQVNPYTLKQLGFAKALDPYTAFQELSMWIGGVLGGTSPEIVTIKDDKTLIEGHGFDNRFSFRGPRIA
jgi:hypothetical protein